MGRLAAQLEAVLAGFGGRATAALLLVLALATVLPGFATLPPVDRDEARYAQATRQMLASGEFVDIRFQDGPRYKKPIGIYWLQAAAVALTGDAEGAAIWRYRLPSLLAAVLAVLATARAAAIFGGVRAGFYAGLILGGCLMLGFEARLATTDAVLLASIALAQLVLARLYRDAAAAGFDPARIAPRRFGALVLFWVAMAASVLVKGPVGPLVSGGTVLVLALWHRRVGWLGALRPGWGLAGFAALVLPWYLAITLKSGGAFWAEALGRDLLGKVAEAQESHGAPPGSYFVALWLTFSPGSVVLALALPALWRARREVWFAFALAWVVPLWLVLEASPTKLPHYVLPLYPALAVAAALVWAEVAGARLRRWQWLAAGLVWLLALGLLVALGVFVRVRFGALPVLPLALGLAAMATGGWLAVVSLRRHLAAAALLGLWLAGAAFAAGIVGVLARVPALWPAPAIAALSAPSGACLAHSLHAGGYYEPSLVFLHRGEMWPADPAAAAAALATDACALALLPAAEAGAFAAAAALVGVVPVLVGEVSGLNIGNGQWVALQLYGR